MRVSSALSSHYEYAVAPGLFAKEKSDRGKEGILEVKNAITSTTAMWIPSATYKINRMFIICMRDFRHVAFSRGDGRFNLKNPDRGVMTCKL